MAVSASQNISLNSTITVTHAGTGYFYRSSNTASGSLSFGVDVPSGATNISATLYYNYNSSYSGAKVNGVACSQGAGYIALGAVSSANVSFSFKAYAVNSQGGLPSATVTRTASWSAYLAVTWDGNLDVGNPGVGSGGELAEAGPHPSCYGVQINGSSEAQYAHPGQSVHLTWIGQDGVPGAEILFYSIYRSINGGAFELLHWNIYTQYYDVPANGNAGHNILYRVTAQSANGYSDALAPMLYTYSAVRAPTSVSFNYATRYPGESVKLSWSGASGGAGTNVIGYHIYQNGVGLTTTTSTSITFDAPAAGSYAYQVYSIANINGYGSGPSPIAGLTVAHPRSTGALNKSIVPMDGASTITLTVTPQGITYNHKAVWFIGGRTWTDTLATNSTESTLTVPLNWCAEVPSAASGTASVRLETYNGATKIGEIVYTFTVTVPATVVPTFTAVTATRVANGVPAAITNYVQNYSKCTLAITGAAGAQNSSISSYKITGGGFTVSVVSGTVGVFTTSGTKTFTATITDSRGRKASKTVSITVEPYSKPTLKLSSIYRSDVNGTADGSGAYVRLKATSVFSSVGGQNSVTLKGRVYPKGGTPGAYTGMASAVASVLGGGLLSAYQTYTGEILITDAIGNTGLYSATIPTESIGLHVLDKVLGAAVGKYCETPGMFQIPDDWTTNIKLGNINGEGKVGTTADLTLMTGAGGLVVARTMAEAISIWKFTNPNLLHNWDFTNPVNQRGVSGAISTGAYFYDRWIRFSRTVTTDAAYLTLDASAKIKQRIEGNLLAGKTVTVSVMAGGTVYSGTGTMPIEAGEASVTLTGWGFATLGYAAGYMYVRIDAAAGASNVQAVKLELGTVSTLAYDPPMDYGVELLKCQRYFWQGAAQDALSYRYGLASNNAHAGHVVFNMRAIPTASIISQPTYSNSSDVSLNASSYGIAIRCTVTADGMYRAFGGIYSASADL